MSRQRAMPFERAAYPWYSLDASAMIDFEHQQPPEYFPRLWQLLGELADRRRLLICEQARRECGGSAVLDPFFRNHPQAVVEFGRMHEYVRAFQRQAYAEGIRLTDPGSTRESADPFVVVLALMLEERDLADLGKRVDPDATCIVVSNERRRKSPQHRHKIPDACDEYGIRCIRGLELVKQEGYVG